MYSISNYSYLSISELTPTMSEPDTSDPIESPRKESDAHSSLRGAVPKTKRRGYGTSTKKRAAKSPSRFRDPLPFFEPDTSDPYSDITIVVSSEFLLIFEFLLRWASPLFFKMHQVILNFTAFLMKVLTKRIVPDVSRQICSPGVRICI